MSRPSTIWHIFTAITLISLLLSASACFRIVEADAVSARPSAAPSTLIVPMNRGLVGSWHFDNNVLDFSGLGNNGAVTGGATYTGSMPGFGKALKSGVNAYGFRAPDSASLDVRTDLALEAWVKLDAVPERSPVVSKVAPKTEPVDLQNSYQLQVGADGHVGMSVWKNQETTTFLRGETLLNLGQWYHLAGSYQYNGDGASIMKVFVDGKLDGSLTNAVGPIYVGTGELMIGRLTGAVDEVHVWNTPYAGYALSAVPMVDISEPGTSHNVTAYVTPAAPGVKVNFEVLPGSVNSGKSASASIDNAGVAWWDYSDTSPRGGQDNIRAWIDRDWSGSFDASNDPSVVLRQIWIKEFVTGLGNIIVDNRVTWTFGGSVGILGRETVGEFELVDHIRKVIYRSDSFSPTNSFFPSSSEGPLAITLPAGSRLANFTGTFTNNRDASTVNLVIWVVDSGEPETRPDRISVKAGTGAGTICIGMTNLDWSTPPPANPYAWPIPISSGNIQVHGP